MPPRGEKPKPSAVRRLTGNPSGRPYNLHEPAIPALAVVPAAAPVAVPPELEGDPVATAEWCRILPVLTKARVLTDADRATMLTCCQQWSRYLKAHGEVLHGPMTVSTPSGYQQPNPCIGISNKALGNLIRLWAELGMTPSSRSRVTVAPESRSTDPFAEFDGAPAAAAGGGYHEADEDGAAH